ncbi:MAG TPA: VIT1/CCC1 transporter family protein [Solirubrobacteraceae bacterium]|nr:VIT1/CCC1 transporter family protein [Solirubrobacteraceae bacterium]
MTGERVERLRRNHRDEIDSAVLYDAMASAEREERLAGVYSDLAAAERRHAAGWAEQLEQLGAGRPQVRPRGRARVLSWLARRFGASLLLPTVAAREQIDRRRYTIQPEAGDALRDEERAHARLLTELRAASPRGRAAEALARTEYRRGGGVGGNALRAAVLGANDGLVSNLSLVMGVAGAELSSATILVTGIAGLLAGALSMAMGEWISVQSSRELYTHQLDVERLEIATMPELETEELALIYRAKGIPTDDAHALAVRIMRDKDTALDAMAREELGFDPEALGGSASVAAIASFVPFTLGAAVPVLPFVFLSGTAATVTSVAASACGLFLLGSAITLLTHRGVVRTGGRQLAIGLAAAAVTFAIGRLVGVEIT